MGCCQSEHPLQSDFKSEIVTYEKKDDHSNIFEDNFYLDSVERYNVKYRPPDQRQNNTTNNTTNNGLTSQKVTTTNVTSTNNLAGNNANINGGSGASGGQNMGGNKQKYN